MKLTSCAAFVQPLPYFYNGVLFGWMFYRAAAKKCHKNDVTFDFKCNMMDILFKDDGAKGAFYVEEAGEELAKMTFVWAGAQKMIIDHTEVSERLGGKGVGKKMVHAAVERARAQGFRIMPLCPFAHSVFEKVPEYRDVLH
ncbi:MAG TPA: GNAT family N-acetyltransferase [Ferruginibacter sp.]|nr:GNAT family N-acetyltransferase [Ferruginibacter sp.]HRQ20388.1 GNAT family N-acetyltransferase [Ferruginibacter sp.]